MGRKTSDPETAFEASQKVGLGLTLRRIFLYGGLAAMVGFPLGALDDGRPAMLGWQMYAGVVELPTIHVVLSNGSRETRPIQDIASGFRPEIDYFEPVARFVCSREQDAVSVHVDRQLPSREEVFQCGTF